MFQLKPCNSALALPLVRVALVLEWAYPLNPCRWKGETAHHGGDVCGLYFVGQDGISALFLRTNPTEREFFVPTPTTLVVKLLTLHIIYVESASGSRSLDIKNS